MNRLFLVGVAATFLELLWTYLNWSKKFVVHWLLSDLIKLWFTEAFLNHRQGITPQTFNGSIWVQLKTSFLNFLKMLFSLAWGIIYERRIGNKRICRISPSKIMALISRQGFLELFQSYSWQSGRGYGWGILEQGACVKKWLFLGGLQECRNVKLLWTTRESDVVKFF